MINSGSTKDLDVNEAVSKIRWPKWTSVTLTIERLSKDGSKNILEKNIVREKLIIPSVKWEIITWSKGQLFWYINISIIGEETENLLKQTLQTFQGQDIKGIILDLRGNGGWLLPVAVEVASHFIPKDSLVVSTKYTTFEDEELLSKWYIGFQWLPIVVLVDGLTASAWEIIALALREQIGAQLIGTQTFGKWSIQTLDEFEDWSSLKYTVGKRYTPNGTSIDTTWALPDILVDFDQNAYLTRAIDNQLQKAKDVLETMIK